MGYNTGMVLLVIIILKKVCEFFPYRSESDDFEVV